MPSVRAPHGDHLPTHRTARDTDDMGAVWLHRGRSDVWGPDASSMEWVRVEAPGRGGGSSTFSWLPAPRPGLTDSGRREARWRTCGRTDHDPRLGLGSVSNKGSGPA